MYVLGGTAQHINPVALHLLRIYGLLELLLHPANTHGIFHVNNISSFTPPLGIIVALEIEHLKGGSMNSLTALVMPYLSVMVHGERNKGLASPGSPSVVWARLPMALASVGPSGARRIRCMYCTSGDGIAPGLQQIPTT